MKSRGQSVCRPSVPGDIPSFSKDKLKSNRMGKVGWEKYGRNSYFSCCTYKLSSQILLILFLDIFSIGSSCF